MKTIIFAILITLPLAASADVQCYKWGDIGPNRPVYTFEGSSCPLGYTKQ